MKILIGCLKCYVEGGNFFPSLVELNDKSFYKTACPKKHYTYYTSPKFEILFDIGLHALIDGYPDAAVSRFAVALERFYEHSIQVLLFAEGMKEQEFKEFWKLIKSNSESQKVTFQTLYYIEKVKNPNLSLPNMVPPEFRNAVIHKGLIPSSQEVRNYAEELYDFIKLTRALDKENI